MPERRHPKLTKAEIRSLLLDAGRKLLLEGTAGVDVEDLTFKRVYDRVEADTGIRLSNGSVIGRVWDCLDDFKAEAMVSIVNEDIEPEESETMEALVAAVGAADTSTPGARRWWLSELCRVGGRANIDAVVATRNWSLWVSVSALKTADRLPDEAERIQTALLHGYERATAVWVKNYEALAGALGYRVRPGLTIEQFSLAAGSLTDGCALRERVDGLMGTVLRPTGPDGEDQEWTIAGIALEGLVDRFFEPDPEAVLY